MNGPKAGITLDDVVKGFVAQRTNESLNRPRIEVQVADDFVLSRSCNFDAEASLNEPRVQRFDRLLRFQLSKCALRYPLGPTRFLDYTVAEQ